MSNQENFNTYFQRADTDRDGRISGAEAVAFFKGANLPQATLAKIWQFSDQVQRGFLLREDFSNALKLVTVAQSGKELTPEIVRAALTGSASSQIPPPRIVFSPGASQPVVYGKPAYVSPSIYSMQQTQAAQTPDSQYRPRTPIQTLPTTQNLLRPNFYGQQPLTAVNSWVASSAVSAATGAQPRPVAGTSIQSLRGPDFQAATHVPFSSGFKNSSSQGGNLATPNLTGQTSSAAAAGGLSNLLSVGNSGPSKLQSAGQDPFQAFVSESSSSLSKPGGFITGKKINTVVPLQTEGSMNIPVPESRNIAVTTSAKQQPQPFSPEQTFRVTSVGSQGSRPLLGPWPKMTQFDVQRYTKIFVEVDSDRDGKISGDQARGLFSSWQLPREVLKQIWDLSDQDGDSMLSLQEFCTALFLMERHREGRPLPSVLPAGFHFEDQVRMQSVSAARIAEAEAAVAQHSAGRNLPAWQQNPRLLQPVGSVPISAGGRPPIDRKLEFNKFKGENGFNFGNQLHNVASNTSQSNGGSINDNVQSMEQSIMNSKEKLEFYRSKMQEIVLFKSRCDNRLTEYTERAAADKHEVESLAKKYDEKFKQTAEINSNLVAEEGVLRNIKERKSELLSAVAQIEQGGNANALLQTRANRIFSDLDELWKALDVRAKRLDIQVEEFLPTEPPFGWKARIQEMATEWEELWEDSDDEEFAPIAGMNLETDESSVHSSISKVIKPRENGLNANQFASSLESNKQNCAATDEFPTSKQTDEFLQADSNNLLVKSDGKSSTSGFSENKSQTVKENVLESMSTGLNLKSNSDLLKDPSGNVAQTSAISSDETLGSHASDFQTSLQPKVNSPSTQVLSSLSYNGFSQGADLLGDFSTKKEDTVINLFKDSVSVSETPLVSTASPTKSSGLQSVGEDVHQSSFLRLDSTTSFGTNRSRAFGSFDDSDLFSSTGPFGFSAGTPKASGRWSSLN